MECDVNDSDRDKGRCDVNDSDRDKEGSAADAPSGLSGSRARRSVWLAMQVLLVRLRFFLTLAGVLLLVGGWPTFRDHWDRLTRSAGGPSGAMSLNMEYWCPMCPGVVSDFPGRCPVCNMLL